MTKTINKRAAARAAIERREKTFTAHCGKHGATDHYAGNTKCVSCIAERNANNRAAQVIRMESPEYAASIRARTANHNARYRMRNMTMPGPQGAIPVPRPENAMPSKATLRECAEVIIRAPAGAQIDHAVPLMGVHPVTGEWVVSGLHVPYNLESMEARSNKRKSNYFDPMAPLEFQKPYNSFPGGQFHGEIGEIEFMRYTVPTTLELWTKGEFVAATVEAGNAAMVELCA